MSLVLRKLYIALKSAGASEDQVEAAAAAEVRPVWKPLDGIDAELKILRWILIYHRHDDGHSLQGILADCPLLRTPVTNLSRRSWKPGWNCGGPSRSPYAEAVDGQ